MATNCLHCGRILPKRSGSGRENVYCDAVCREDRRAQLEKLQWSDRHCEYCGSHLSLYHAKRNSKYCSYRCSGLANRSLKNQTCICIICGEEFTPKKKGQICCGLDCSMVKRKETLKNSITRAPDVCSMCGELIDYPVITGITNEIRYCDECRGIHERDRSRQRRLITRKQCVETINDAVVFERDEWICKICNKPVDSRLDWPDPLSPSLDHIVPVSKGGLHEYGNVQLAHLGCNSRKQNRYEARA